MLKRCGEKVINLDAIFGGQHSIPIGRNTEFDQVMVFQEWFQFWFEETAEIVGRLYIYPRDPVDFGDYQARTAFLALRSRFLDANNNPQNNTPPVHILDPKNMPVH